MRYVCARGNHATKFWQYKLKRMANSNWAVFVRYGLINSEGEDMPLVTWTCAARGSLKQCRKAIQEKVHDRLQLDYKPA
jgi:hypothetical protein